MIWRQRGDRCQASGYKVSEMVSEDLHEMKSGRWQNRSGGGLHGGGRPRGPRGPRDPRDMQRNPRRENPNNIPVNTQRRLQRGNPNDIPVNMEKRRNFGQFRYANIHHMH